MHVIFSILLFLLAGFFFYQNWKRNKAASANLAKGKQFLTDNGQKDDVLTTSSGLQYQILQEGSGENHPKLTSKVTVHYHGTLLNGDVFNSSVDNRKPITFSVKQVIKGWQEGLQLMVVGQKVRFFIPPALAYGNRRAGKIPPGSVLIFDIELLEIK
ncbi:FKBP-type peptidyl-prolyl cis-trans isomerase [Vibrio sp. PP-XX7]